MQEAFHLTALNPAGMIGNRSRIIAANYRQKQNHHERQPWPIPVAIPKKIQ
jgi:hypothetical protein